MSKNFCIIVGILLCGSPVYPQARETPSHDFKKLMIDPDQAMGGKVSKYFEEVNFIPLETTKESLFGKIDKLQVTDKYFIIQDNTTDAILFFNKDGSFHHKITNFSFDRTFSPPGQAGRKYDLLFDFHVTPANHNIYVMSSIERGRSLYVYDEKGTRLEKITFPRRMLSYFMLNDGTTYYKEWRPSPYDNQELFKPYDISYTKDSSNQYQYLFPVNFKHAALPGDLSMHLSYFKGATGDSTCLYTPDFDYNIYELGTSGIKTRYQLLFPRQYAIPPNFGNDSIYANKRKAYLKDKKLITGIWAAYKTGNYLILDIRIPEGGSRTLLYSLNTSRLITLDRLSPDNKSNHLAVSGYNRSEILACETSGIYFSLPSLSMFSIKASFGDKPPAFNSVLDKYFKTQDRKSNPVLIQLKPKENI